MTDNEEKLRAALKLAVEWAANFPLQGAGSPADIRASNLVYIAGTQALAEEDSV